MMPSEKPEMVIRYDEPVCCGQFSDDGNFFYACVKASNYCLSSTAAVRS
jgi:WD repeat-containing protein 23